MIMNLTKKIIGITIVAASCLTSNPVRADDWVFIGNSKGFDYYVDTDREIVRGYLWAAPIRAIDSNRSNRNYLGEAVVNCRNYTVRIEFGNNVNNWSRINRDSPMDFVGRQVCF